MRKLMRSDEIVNSSISTDDLVVCGVYFLVADGRVAYVGQSKDIHARVGRHRREKLFERVSWVECAEEDLDRVEGEYIRELRPPLNIKIPGDTERLSARDVRRIAFDEAGIDLGEYAYHKKKDRDMTWFLVAKEIGLEWMLGPDQARDAAREYARDEGLDWPLAHSYRCKCVVCYTRRLDMKKRMRQEQAEREASGFYSAVTNDPSH